MHNLIKTKDEEDEEREYDPDELQRVSIQLRVKTISKIDAKRGIVNISPYLRQLIEKHIDEAPTYPPEEEF